MWVGALKLSRKHRTALSEAQQLRADRRATPERAMSMRARAVAHLNMPSPLLSYTFAAGRESMAEGSVTPARKRENAGSTLRGTERVKGCL